MVLDKSILLRGVLAYISLLILARLMGKREISQMTYFDFIVGITIGGATANVISDTTKPFIDLLQGVIVLSIMQIVTSYLSLKSIRFRRLYNGSPIFLIKEGRIIEENLKKEKINTDELMVKLRGKDVFNLSEVEAAVFETDGTINVLKKPSKNTVTLSDMNIKAPKSRFPEIVIEDGNLLLDSLRSYGLTKAWLMSELSKQGIHDIKSVMLAQIDSQGQLYVDLYENSGQ